ncbi:MAG: recombination protein RecR [Deltaproteobacteria bacterium]|nr:recombination protein RecR [Deltaproteobacteria bacterium]MBW2661038.1 recombination protein RecR [Deltaproteobacteria bacterium]
MSYYPSLLMDLIRNICRLPGIGEKTAERLAMYILKAPRSEAEQLSRNILKIKDRIKLCSICYAFSDGEICDICRDSTRVSTLLCVVEQPADMVSIEKSGCYKGLYHILQGALSPMNGIGPDKIRIRELISRMEDNKVKEIILATGTNVEGEATASYITQRLKDYPVKITRIASGVPVGGDLKYVDQVTLRKAMETRHTVE